MKRLFPTLIAILGIIALLIASCKTSAPTPQAKKAVLAPRESFNPPDRGEIYRPMQQRSAEPKPQRGATHISWSVKRRPADSESFSNDLYLRFQGQDHLIDRQIICLKGPRFSGKAPNADLKRLRAMSGYFFEWHISGVTYFARVEPGVVLVYAEAWGDENEGETFTRRVKTIRY